MKQETVHLILGRLNLKLLELQIILREAMDQITFIQQTQMKGLLRGNLSQITLKTVQHSKSFSKLTISLNKLSHISNLHVTL